MINNDVAHEDRVQRDNVVGEFCGTPIVTLDETGIRVDELRDTRRRVFLGKSSKSPSTAEVLPGEVICSDNLIRRVTTAEVTKQGRYAEGKAYGSEKLADLCALHAIMGSSENLRGHRSQSTPEELCAWLNAQEKCSFKHEVVIEGRDKILRATDKKGTLVYAFRYIDGLPGSYIGGEETRLLEPPRYGIGKYSLESRVVEYYITAKEEA